MAECIIARGGGRSDGESSVPIVSDRCSLVISIYDTDNKPLSDMSVHCKDGNTWYNYHTNEKGQVLFMTNSGSANITAYNFSIQNNFMYLDMENSNTINIDAPIAQKKEANIVLGYKTTAEISGSTPTYNLSQYLSTINSIQDSYYYAGNCFVHYANKANVILWGGGGGGGSAGSMTSGGGGGGGAINIGNDIELDHSKPYTLRIGGDGRGGHVANNFGDNGSSGGTTTIFNLSANGGSGGGFGGKGGLGGIGLYNGGNGGNWLENGYDHSYSGGGGGGAGGTDPATPRYNLYGGNQDGGNSRWSGRGNDAKFYNQKGFSVGAGGAGGSLNPTGGKFDGGNGGIGKIQIYFRR